MKLGVLWLNQLYDHQNDSYENTKYKSYQHWLPEHKILQYTCLSIFRMEAIDRMKTSSKIKQLCKPLGLGSPMFILQ